MKLAILVILVASSLAALGDNITTNMPAPTVKKVRDSGFAVASPLDATKQTIVSAAASPQIMAIAEKRFIELGNTNVFKATPEGVLLDTSPSTSDHTDAFIACAKIGQDEITALVLEFQTDFNVFLGKPVPHDGEMARSEFHSWVARLLNPARQEQFNDKDVEVLDKGEYFVVRKVLHYENGARRLPWTKSESLKLAVDKNGRWLILSVEDLPDAVSSMPAGRRGRGYGSWFSSPINPKEVGKKQAVQ